MTYHILDRECVANENYSPYAPSNENDLCFEGPVIAFTQKDKETIAALQSEWGIVR